MKQQLILQILREPDGKSPQEIKDACLAAADEIERLNDLILSSADPNELQPLPEAILVAGEFRHMAKKMILLAQRLEAIKPPTRAKSDLKGAIERIKRLIK